MRNISFPECNMAYLSIKDNTMRQLFILLAGSGLRFTRHEKLIVSRQDAKHAKKTLCVFASLRESLLKPDLFVKMLVSPGLLVLALFIPAVHAEGTITLEKPPASLKQWYKPENKRNVWHHNMFKLRREIQAVNEYMEVKDQPHTEKWAIRLVTHYRKIAEMVPEWRDELELEWADKLEAAAKQGEFKALGTALKKLQSSCKGCHSDYRAQVAAIYRGPDFSKIDVKLDGKETSYLDFMKILMRDVNRIKIAAEDDDKARAQAAMVDVRSGISILRSSCDSCHKEPEAKEYYLGTKTDKLLDELQAGIDKGDSGHALGILAVQACARCHGSHRIVYDLKAEIE
jgi:cytochrome c556